MEHDIDHSWFFSDFTETSYAELLDIAKRQYAFARFVSRPEERHVLWRHDVDFSMHRALRLAEIEAEAGVTASYFLYPRSLFYNLLSRRIVDIARKIVGLGHDIGLHFDPTFYGDDMDRKTLFDKVAWEGRLLQDLFGVAPVAVSFHLFGVLRSPMLDDDVVSGMVNAYGATIRQTYSYISDSNGIWRFRRLRDVLEEGADDRLHVLTHPEWWTPEVMAPRTRLQRCIDGYAAAMGDSYDRILAESDRPNVR